MAKKDKLREKRKKQAKANSKNEKGAKVVVKATPIGAQAQEYLYMQTVWGENDRLVGQAFVYKDSKYLNSDGENRWRLEIGFGDCRYIIENLNKYRKAVDPKIYVVNGDELQEGKSYQIIKKMFSPDEDDSDFEMLEESKCGEESTCPHYDPEYDCDNECDKESFVKVRYKDNIYFIRFSHDKKRSKQAIHDEHGNEVDKELYDWINTCFEDWVVSGSEYDDDDEDDSLRFWQGGING